jgi:hypothetical protein
MDLKWRNNIIAELGSFYDKTAQFRVRTVMTISVLIKFHGLAVSA